MKRRTFLKAGLATGPIALTGALGAPLGATQIRPHKGNVNHSVCKWCYPNMSVEVLARAASDLGLGSVELLDPADWPVLQRLGLTCGMVNSPGPIKEGFNRLEHHEWLLPAFEERIRETAAAGYDKIVCFSGNREGLSDELGLAHCAVGLKQLMPLAEQLGVTLCMEPLNSKVDHLDYQCDTMPWAVALCDRVGSERFKLLYDIYHMQIMEGDVIRTIQTYSPYIAHYHTAGNPGRNEIDDTQELNYPAIMRAIVETGFEGFVAQEFIPTRDPLTSLREAIAICDV